MIDGCPHVLTVDHVVPDDLREDDSPPILITHPSEQDAVRSAQMIDFGNYAVGLKASCCTQCNVLWQEYHVHRNLFLHEVLRDTNEVCCPQAQEFVRLKDEVLGCLGSMIWRSRTRSRPSRDSFKAFEKSTRATTPIQTESQMPKDIETSGYAESVERGQHEVEMDWALVSTEQWPTDLEEPMREWSKDVFFSKVSPGARVVSCGRTSGYQTGEISLARSSINHGPRYNPRFTEEWTVIKDPETPWKDWIEGGMGVDGDSGSWIIDEHTKALYGMVWGRDRPRTQSLCLFSPMLDIISDIKQRTGATTVCLPGQFETAEVSDKGKRIDEGKAWTAWPRYATRSQSEGIMVSEQPAYADGIY